MTKKNNGSIWAALLAAVLALYGAADFAVRRILSAQALSGALRMTKYQSTLTQMNEILGIVATILLVVLGVACVIFARGRKRVGFILWLPAAFAPLFSAYATRLLFSVLGLPGVGAGSVVAGLASALLLAVPCIVGILVLADKTTPKWARRCAALCAWLGLLIALYPTIVAVLALVVMAGNPAMVPFMNASPVMISARYIVFAAGLFFAMWKAGDSHA